MHHSIGASELSLADFVNLCASLSAGPDACSCARGEFEAVMIVLIVEDQAIAAINLAVELETAGHTVIGPASHCESAIALAREHRPALALVDISLQSPQDGVPLARTLKELGVPSLFLTAQPEAARANTDAALGLIEKPYITRDVRDSLDVVAAVLAGRKPATYTSALELFRPPRHGAGD